MKELDGLPRIGPMDVDPPKVNDDCDWSRVKTNRLCALSGAHTAARPTAASAARARRGMANLSVVGKTKGGAAAARPAAVSGWLLSA